MRMDFTFAGDAIMVHKLNMGYSGFAPVSDFIRRAEARLVNLELVLTDKSCFASSFCGGTWVGVDKSILPDILSYGFNYCSLANNHIMDYSYNGMFTTIGELDKYGVAYSGAGENLYEASKPAIINLPSARIAVISICSSFDDSARAGDQSRTHIGRPGLNPLRFESVYTVTEEQMKHIRKAAEGTYINGENGLREKDGFIPGDRDGIFTFGDIKLKTGSENKKETVCNKVDLERTKKSISDALKVADYVIVIAHSHQIKTNSFSYPDYFLEEFCRECIDANAHAVICGGTHQLKPVEIYKGRPIFYSLGNFIFQSNVLFSQPVDFNEKYGYPADTTAPDAIFRRSEGGKKTLHAKPQNFRTVIPYLAFEGDKLVRMELKPLELGFGKDRTFKGLPYEADEKVTQEICEDLNNLSSSYGCSFKVKNGLIEAELS